MVLANLQSLASNDCDHGAKNGQCGGVCYAERGMGKIQDGEWALRDCWEKEFAALELQVAHGHASLFDHWKLKLGMHHTLDYRPRSMLTGLRYKRHG